MKVRNNPRDKQEHVLAVLDSLHSGIFATRETNQGAYKELRELIESTPEEYRHSLLVGLHVLLNTISNDLKKIVTDNTKRRL